MAGQTGQPEKMGNSCLKAPAAFCAFGRKPITPQIYPSVTRLAQQRCSEWSAII
jgi:hypothetical protein